MNTNEDGSQKTAIFILAAMKTWNPTWAPMICILKITGIWISRIFELKTVIIYMILNACLRIFSTNFWYVSLINIFVCSGIPFICANIWSCLRCNISRTWWMFNMLLSSNNFLNCQSTLLTRSNNHSTTARSRRNSYCLFKSNTCSRISFHGAGITQWLREAHGSYKQLRKYSVALGQRGRTY
jgi:hypothetical protein